MLAVLRASSRSLSCSTRCAPAPAHALVPLTLAQTQTRTLANRTHYPIRSSPIDMSATPGNAPTPQNAATALPTDASLPGEHFEVRQTSASDDYHPDPAKSLPLSPARQALLDDILALYSCEPTRRRVERYTPDCVYDDQFVYANDRYKMAGQWFALPKLFRESKNEGYEVVLDEPGLIQFKNEQVCSSRWLVAG